MVVYSLHRKDTTTTITLNKEYKVTCSNEDTLVVTLRVELSDICHILVDPGSSINLLFLSMLHALEVHKKDITKKEIPLVGFNSSIT